MRLIRAIRAAYGAFRQAWHGTPTTIVIGGDVADDAEQVLERLRELIDASDYVLIDRDKT